MITDISLLLECIFPSIKTFHFPRLAPSVELDGFRHLFASVGFICLVDLHYQWKTIKDFDLENTNVNKEKTKQNAENVFPQSHDINKRLLMTETQTPHAGFLQHLCAVL